MRIGRRDFLKASLAALAMGHGGLLLGQAPQKHFVWMRPSPPWLERAIPIAARSGLELHAWMWCMPCLIPAILRDHPDWYNVNANGESAATKPAYVDYYKFLDPAHPDVRAFVRDTVRELAAMPGLTGIQLDYIRHPDAILPSDLWAKYGIVQDKVYPQYDYGYTTLSRNAFKAAHGVDPITLPDPESNAAWLAYRLDTVVGLVNDYLVPAAKAGGKQISAAVFPGPSLARTMVRQDWGRFRLDAYFPMLYHTFPVGRSVPTLANDEHPSCDLLLPKPYKDDGKAVNGWEIAGLKSAVHLDGTLNRWQDEDRGWSVELALPWKALGELARRPSPPADGDQWRVNFSRVEWPLQ